VIVSNGEPMQGRTIILVSHHNQLYCTGGKLHNTALDGRVLFEGSNDRFYNSGITIKSLVQSTDSSGQPDEK